MFWENSERISRIGGYRHWMSSCQGILRKRTCKLTLLSIIPYFIVCVGMLDVVHGHMGYEGDPFVPTTPRAACTGTTSDLWDCVCMTAVRCASHVTPPRPVIGKFEEFVMFGSLITCTLGDTVYGNMGVATEAGTIGVVVLGSEDEFGNPNQENFTKNYGDALAVEAASDLSTVLDAIVALGPGYLLGGTADISGFIFYPGLYTTTTTMAIASGKMTLDALGVINSVFIFSAVRLPLLIIMG
jgi:hypothetical protein